MMSAPAQALEDAQVDGMGAPLREELRERLNQLDRQIAAVHEQLALLNAVLADRERTPVPDGFAQALSLQADAVSRMSRGDALNAEAAARASLALNPGSAEARFTLGWVLHESGRYAEAEALYRLALDKAPRHAGAWFNLGNLLIRLHQESEAVAAWQKAAGYGHEGAIQQLGTWTGTGSGPVIRPEGGGRIGAGGEARPVSGHREAGGRNQSVWRLGGLLLAACVVVLGLAWGSGWLDRRAAPVSGPASAVREGDAPAAAAPGRLVLRLSPEDSVVRIVTTGELYQPAMSLPAGTYHIRVSRAGYVTLDTRIVVPGGSDVVVPVTLVAEGSG
jgi:tetratricopeptide (TPR) repeat protein